MTQRGGIISSSAELLARSYVNKTGVPQPMGQQAGGGSSHGSHSRVRHSSSSGVGTWLLPQAFLEPCRDGGLCQTFAVTIFHRPSSTWAELKSQGFFHQQKATSASMQRVLPSLLPQQSPGEPLLLSPLLEVPQFLQIPPHHLEGRSCTQRR